MVIKSNKKGDKVITKYKQNVNKTNIRLIYSELKIFRKSASSNYDH
jgi:hypothetical protein